MLTSGRTVEAAAESLVRSSPEHRRAQAFAALAAAGSAMGAYCLAMAVHGTYPFGGRSRAVNDLGNQFVPLHAHLWDLMHGRGTGDLFINWNSGYGVPFLADFLTYLTNPFSWLVAVFPRDAVQAPVFLVTLLSIGLGTALMTVFLGRLHPGSPWARAVLSVGYGVSTWTISDGFSDPMWMWGVVCLPLLGIADDWALLGRRWVAGAAVVAVCWAGNFYTAAMATLGMGLVLLVRLALDERPERERGRERERERERGRERGRGQRQGRGRGRVLLRAVSMTAAGVALAAPVLTVTYRASKASQQPLRAVYPGPPGLRDYLAHLLPGGPTPSAPQISTGVLTLLLVLTFPFMRRVRPAERLLWPALLLLVALSYVWEPTILLWHGLALPNGSPYRASLTLTAMTTAVAWLALARGPRPRELLGGAGLLALLVLTVSGSAYLTAHDLLLVVADAAVVTGLLVLLHRASGRRRARAALTAVLACSVFLATAFTVWSVTVRRDRDPWWRPKRTIDAQSLAARADILAREDWPASRTDPGPHEFADNDPLLLGGEGGAYYSSYVPARTAAALRGQGAAWYMRGRHLLSPNDPVGRAIMGVSSYFVASPQGPLRRAAAAPPVVTYRPGAAFDTRGARDASVFARQERVLGADVWTAPALTPAAGPAPATAPGDAWRLPAAGKGARTATRTTAFRAACAPGSAAYVDLPWFSGTITANGVTYRRTGAFPGTDNGLLPAGAVPADGTLTLVLAGTRAQTVPRHAVGCLDRAALGRAVATLRATGPERVTAGGHTIDATFRPGRRGTAVVAVPAVSGWRCSVDGGPAKAPRTLGGLMAVPLGGGSRLTCSYRPPGLRLGLSASGSALALLVAVAVAGPLRRRPPRTAHTEDRRGNRWTSRWISRWTSLWNHR